MDVAEALSRIEEIHGQLAKAEIYRGYRPLAVALSGVAGLLAAVVSPLAIPTPDPMAFLMYWLSVGALCGAIAGGGPLLDCFRGEVSKRRRTRIVVGQFLPCLIAGGLVAVGFAQPAFRASMPLLPGIWALLFGLGVVSSRPYLPRAAGLVTLWYFAAGFYILWSAPAPWSLTGLEIGVTFGLGQLGMALALLSGRPSFVEDAP